MLPTRQILPVFGAKTLFFVLSAFLLVLLPFLSRDYGITWDEWMDSNKGMLTLRNILSGGKDMAFMGFWHGYLYSELFYTVVGSLYGLSSGSIQVIAHEGLHDDARLIPFYTFSHAVNSLFGFAAMFFTGLLAKKAGTWRTAVFALLFIALSPRFFGNSMNNPKDIPFAATYAMALYALVRYLEGLPEMKWKDWVFLALGIGACIGMRIGGILLLGYLFIFAFLILSQLLITGKIDKKCALQHLGIAGGIALLGIAAGYIFWPYGRMDPVRNTLSAIQKISTFDYWKGQVVFEGKTFKGAHLPWYYTLKWMAISSPLFILTSPFLAVFSFVIPRLDRGIYMGPRLKHSGTTKSVDSRWSLPSNDLIEGGNDKRILSDALSVHLPILFAAVFPLAYMILRQTPVLDGWRHSLFVYPSLVVFAALTWDQLLEPVRPAKQKWMAGSCLVLLLLEPLSWMVKNHPNTYVYFNPLVGGVRGALGKYETDYWGNCLRPAAEWLADYHKKNVSAQFPMAVVRADGQIMQTYPFLRMKLGNQYTPLGYPQDFVHKDPYFFVDYGPLSRPLPWNYAIVFSRNFTPEEIRSGGWPPQGTIHEIKADGAALCAVVENPGFKEFLKKH